MARPNGKGCAECHRINERERRRRSPDDERRRAADYQRKNRQKVNARIRVWRAGNKHQKNRYRTAPSDIEYVLILGADPCSFCGGPAGEVDHIEPIAKGGEPGWRNLTAACRSCNARKSARGLLTYLLIAE